MRLKKTVVKANVYVYVIIYKNTLELLGYFLHKIVNHNSYTKKVDI